MATNGKFEPLAIEVATGSTIKAAAAKTGFSERSAYRHASTEAFRLRVTAIRSEIAAATVGTLTQAASQAAATLLSLLDASQEPSIRLNASKAILASVGPMAELGELRARIDALEAKTN